MLKHLTILIFFGVSTSCFGQLPLPIKQLQPKIDSIQNEANTLYAYEVSTQRALRSAKKAKTLFDNFLTYQNGDSTFVLLLTEEKKCKQEFCFLTDYTKPKTFSSRLRALNKQESELLRLQESLIQKAKVLSTDTIEAEKGFDLHSLLVPAKEMYHLYYLTATEKDSIYPSGNDYLFVFNKNEELVEQDHLAFQKYSLLKKDQTYGSKLLGISYAFTMKKGLLPFAINICKFRIYYQNIGFPEFRANWNRRDFTFNAAENKVKIHLFYNEKLSPQYRNNLKKK